MRMRYGWTAVLLFTLCGGAFAASRTEDLRAKPPERWAPVKNYGLDLELGGLRQQGNVDQTNVHSGLKFRTVFQERHQFFVEWNSDYTSFGGARKVDKMLGSFLYAYSAAPHVNLFFHTTHGHNDAIKLDYRTKNGLPGVCLHGFFKPYLDTFMASTSLVTEHESYQNGENRTNTRAGNRLNFSGPISQYASFSGDFYYVPKLNRIGDYWLSWEGWVQFKLTPERVSFRVTVTDEYESRPVVTGVRRNDFGMMYSVVVHLWK
ncbi:MAG: DUF481 domain-containing protein [Elusimicrobia bacterium]|nr:DUF481 domain-containing protein [Elusimicrobiota bacterium]